MSQKLTHTELLNTLRSLTDGLLWMSEADYPIEVFCWDDVNDLTPEAVRDKTGHSPETSVKTVGIDSFFQSCTTEEDWHNEEEKAEVKRFQDLLGCLEDNLNKLTVYLIGEGEREREVYIVGQSSGQFIGVKTKIVET